MITRFDLIVFFVWQLAIYFACQQLFPIFANWIPLACRNVTDNSNISLLSLDDDCALSPRCADGSQFHSMAVDFGLICARRAYLLPLLGNIQFVGVLFGTIVFGYLSDRFGRKRLSIVCTSFGVVTTILSGMYRLNDYHWFLYRMVQK